jgi:large subunit ribosomal protein L10
MSESTTSPRPEKVAIVAEVAEKIRAARAVFVTEYRGLTVGQLADLRSKLREAETELTVYKNTLVRRAVSDVGIDGLDELLVGPTALAFIHGDVAAAAKVLRDVSKNLPLLVVKGGTLDGAALSADDVKVLADLPSRDELLARFAGALQAPMVKTAGLLQALPRNFAYGLSALIDQHEAA